MSQETKTEVRHIYLYTEDFDCDVWQEYCNVCGVPDRATEIKIIFKEDDVLYDE